PSASACSSCGISLDHSTPCLEHGQAVASPSTGSGTGDRDTLERVARRFNWTPEDRDNCRGSWSGEDPVVIRIRKSGGIPSKSTYRCLGPGSSGPLCAICHHASMGGEGC